jgi:formylmethanofuran dehydrogenase subunit E
MKKIITLNCKLPLPKQTSPASKSAKGIARLILFGMFIMVLGAYSCSPEPKSQTSGAWLSYYKKAGTITVADPMASLVGSLPHGRAHITITLVDVAKYTGHVCPGVYSGFIMTRRALHKLYPESIPRRGQIKITGNFGHSLLDVAAYITGARADYGRGEINQGDLSLDKTLGKDQADKVIIFERKDTGQQVKAVFHCNAILSPSKRAAFKKNMMKVLTGKASRKEKKKLAQKIQAKVMFIMKGGNIQKIISIKKL